MIRFQLIKSNVMNIIQFLTETSSLLELFFVKQKSANAIDKQYNEQVQHPL